MDRLALAPVIKDFGLRIPEIMEAMSWNDPGLLFGVTRKHGSTFMVPPQIQHLAHVPSEPCEGMVRVGHSLLYHSNEHFARVLRKEMFEGGELIAVGIAFELLTHSWKPHTEVLTDVELAIMSGQDWRDMPNVRHMRCALVVDMNAVAQLFTQPKTDGPMLPTGDESLVGSLVSSSMARGLMETACALAFHLPPGQASRDDFMVTASARMRDVLRSFESR